MTKTLVQVIQEIDASPKFGTREERDQIIRRVFKQSMANSVVRARFEGVSFWETYLKLNRGYDSARGHNSKNDTESLLDGYKQTVNSMNQIGDLAECFLDVQQRKDYLSGKVNSGMILGGAGGLIMSYILLRGHRIGDAAENLPVQMPLFANLDDTKSEDTPMDGESNAAKPKLSRRDILLNGLKVIIITSSMASLSGYLMLANGQETAGIDLARQNAKYLDDTYQRVFSNTSAHREPTSLNRRGFFSALYKRA